MDASPMLLLDNLNNKTFKSDLLASVLTERPARVRVLGRSQMVPLNSAAFIVLTGNGLTLSEDLARRFIVVELDPRTEDPEARPFTNDIRDICRARHSELLGAALTIWRWGRQQSGLARGLPLGSFGLWSRWVRDPLVALGCKDCVARVSETKGRDGRRAEIIEVFEIWWQKHQDQPVAAKDLHEDVKQALNPLGLKRQFLASRLQQLTGTRIAGWVLLQQPSIGRHGAATYVLRRSDDETGSIERRGGPDGQLAAGYAPYAPYAIPPRGGNQSRSDAPSCPLPHGSDVASDGGATSNTLKNSVEPEKHRGHKGHTHLNELSLPPSGTEAERSDSERPVAGWRKRL